MIFQTEITLQSYRKGFHLITREILQHLPALPEKGLLHLFLKHTSAGLTINENADPDVQKDMFEIFNRLVPENQQYEHARKVATICPHMPSTLTGVGLLIPITNGHLNHRIWQEFIFANSETEAGIAHW